MGAFLDKPVTEKHTSVGQGRVGDSLLRFGVSGMQGWRLEMEDAFIAQTETNGEQIAMFSVFDGHAGINAALHAAQHIPRIVALQEGFERAETNPDDLGECLAEAYMDIDVDMLEIPNFKSGADHSGCTALTVCVMGTHYVFANAGDSRGILVNDNRVVFGTKDHKPDNPEEMDRIVKAGGVVIEKRVNGDLAVSRALGDFFYKRAVNVEPAEQPVTAKPDITIVPRNNDKDQFLLLCCDGVWDVMNNDDAARFVLDKMNIGYGLGRMCELLIDHCLELGSHDNMTAIIVALPNAPKQIGTFREPVSKPSGRQDRGE